MDFVTFFSGMGGYDLGAMSAGANHLMGYEWDGDIAERYRANIGHVRVGDILDVDPATVPDAHLYHLSPPCQDFSAAKPHAMRSSLSRKKPLPVAVKLGEIIKRKLPANITFENVVAWRKSADWFYLYDVLMSCGYFVASGMFDMSYYGVPQSRGRFIVIARRGAFVRQLVADDTPMAWGDVVSFDEIKQMNVSSNVVDISADDCIVDAKNLGRENATFRPHNQPSFTITSNIGSHALFFHNKQRYNASVESLAKLQSIHSYDYVGATKSLAVKMIGNAVPPAFAERVVSSLM